MTQKLENISRQHVKELDEILGKSFKVLNDGFVRVIDYLGSDTAIVQAARVSYGSGTTKIRQDRTLIRYLLRHQHTSPFEMCEMKFHVRVPMDCWRQWIRHRTANVNEYSTRYSIAMEGTQTTPPAGWRLQAKNNRQGSEGTIDRVLGKKLSDEEKELHSLTRKVYNKRIEAGIAREQARKDLPLSTYTEAYWKIDLGNLLHFLALRMEKNAQYEIRSYAEIIGNEIVSRWCPLVWEAFRDYTMNSVCFSSHEQKILQALLKGNKPQAVKIAGDLEWLKEKEGTLVRHYEREEFEDKLKQMKISAPWE